MCLLIHAPPALFSCTLNLLNAFNYPACVLTDTWQPSAGSDLLLLGLRRRFRVSFLRREAERFHLHLVREQLQHRRRRHAVCRLKWGCRPAEYKSWARTTTGTQRRINSCRWLPLGYWGTITDHTSPPFLRVILLIINCNRNAESCEKWIKHIHLLILTNFTWLYLLISDFSRAGQQSLLWGSLRYLIPY